MKRFLLSVAAVATLTGAFALSAPQHMNFSRQANPLKGRSPLASFVENKAPRQQQRVLFREGADNQQLSINWGYCEGISMAIPMDAGEMRGAMVIDAETATKYAGATLTSISVGNPVDVSTETPDYEQMVYVYDNPIREATVWLAESFDKEPFMTAKGELGERGFVWSTIELPEAYTLKAGTPVVVGFTIEVPENDDVIYPLVTDYSYDVNENSCMVYTNFNGFDDTGWLVFEGERKWQDLGEEFGNIAIRARLNGDMFPVNDVITYMYQGPLFVTPGEPFEFLVEVQNQGGNTISSVEYTMEIDGMQPQTCTVDISPALDYKDISNVLSLTFDCTTEGNNIHWKAYLSAINGEKVNLGEEPAEGTFLCISEGFPKNNVFEEATGTWCGWCVLGYAGMEYMSEHYGEEGFIGIAVHGSDEMDVMGEGQAYEVFSEYVQGFPSAYLNRDMSEALYPDPSELEMYYEYYKDLPAYAKISATVEDGESSNVIKLSTVSEFGGDEDNANYQIAYTVIENGVGPYLQHNYCSGEDYDYYGFENKPEILPLVYNDVARNCSQPMGIENSLPSVIESGKTYSYDTEITLSDVTDPKKVRVVAMVINKNNGAIENAVCVEVPGYTGVNQIAAPSQAFAYGSKGAIKFRVNPAKAAVYTIDGRCVANGVNGNSLQLPAGVYVVALNGKACKVAVR